MKSKWLGDEVKPVHGWDMWAWLIHCYWSNTSYTVGDLAQHQRLPFPGKCGSPIVHLCLYMHCVPALHSQYSAWYHFLFELLLLALFAAPWFSSRMHHRRICGSYQIRLHKSLAYRLPYREYHYTRQWPFPTKNAWTKKVHIDKTWATLSLAYLASANFSGIIFSDTNWWMEFQTQTGLSAQEMLPAWEKNWQRYDVLKRVWLQYLLGKGGTYYQVISSTGRMEDNFDRNEANWSSPYLASANISNSTILQMPLFIGRGSKQPNAGWFREKPQDKENMRQRLDGREASGLSISQLRSTASDGLGMRSETENFSWSRLLLAGMCYF